MNLQMHNNAQQLNIGNQVYIIIYGAGFEKICQTKLSLNHKNRKFYLPDCEWSSADEREIIFLIRIL